MRILIICYVYPPEVASAGPMVRQLAQDLAREGHDVTVLTGWPNHPAGKVFPGYSMRWRSVESDGRHRVMRVAHAVGSKIAPIRRMWIYFTFAVSSLANGLTLGRHDVVVSLSTPIFGVWTAWLLAKCWGARFVNVLFDIWPEAIINAGLARPNALYRLVRRIDTLNCQLSDVISTLGEGMRQMLIHRGIEPAKVKVIPFWIDTDEIRPLPRDNAWRREQGIAPDKFVALFAGTVGYASGVQVLVEAAKHLQSRSDILIVVVGEGPVKKEIEELARASGVGNMRLFPFQPAERVAELQSAADVGLVTLQAQSGASSVPSKMLGYMAAGRAVIASAAPETDTAKLIAQADCGLTVPAQDAAAIAEAIRTLADDPDRCRHLGSQARRCTEQLFSPQAVLRQYKQVIVPGWTDRPESPPP